MVEHGNHESLMRIDGGHYKKLVERQSETSSAKVEEELPLDPADELESGEEGLAHLNFENVTFSYPTR